MAGEAANTTGTEHWAWLFEAKGVQRYIFDSGRLPDLVGASDLVAGIASSDHKDLLEEAVAAAGLKGALEWSRRAGGVMCVHAHDRVPLDRMRDLMRLAVGLSCPGLEYVDGPPVAATSPADAMDAAYKVGNVFRSNSAAESPPAGHPLTAFNPRTGRVMTELRWHGEDQTPTPLDVLSAAQRRHADTLLGGDADDRVARRFLPARCDASGATYVFPRNLDADEPDDEWNPAFPYLGEDRRIALVHADLSGLAQKFRSVTNVVKAAGASTGLALEVATIIEDVLEAAAKAATSAVLVPERGLVRYGRGRDAICLAVLPARPVLLGGDDVTIIVRADLAARFTQRFLEEIEYGSAKEFGKLANGRDEALRTGLTACAGIVVARSGMPFLLLNRLAEDLCKLAKGYAKYRDPKTRQEPRCAPYASLVAMHNQQSTAYESYDDIRAREFTAPGGYSLTGSPYGVGEIDAGAASLDALFTLAQAMHAAPRGLGKVIEAAKVLFDCAVPALESLRRWHGVLAADDGSACKVVDDAILKFGLSQAEFGALFKPDGPAELAEVALAKIIGPLSDALELRDIGAPRAWMRGAGSVGP